MAPSRHSNRSVGLQIGIGLVLFVYFVSWWSPQRIAAAPWLIAVLVLALAYSLCQILATWLLYLYARPRPPVPPVAGLTVDVFVPVYREPLALVARTLKAACKMQVAHRTWLLDDGPDPRLERLARCFGAGYLTRPDRTGYKAGNVNAALARTSGDIVVIFDADHTPTPDFLARTLGYFGDPQVGFVQVMLNFSNADAGWVARAAAETALDFYNPTAMGMDRLNSATLMGSNALIRRTALASIGGYRAGLAEDLATSLALHAAGWSSAYVAEPLAPGLTPADLTAWFTQQLKWARGVFDLLLSVFPRVFRRLTWGQRLSYTVRMTKYWIGPAVGLHLFATIAVLIFADAAQRLAFHQYLLHLGPLLLADVLIRSNALRVLGHSSVPRTGLSRALMLVYATWPIYLLAWCMAVLRLPLAFRLTPKGAGAAVSPVWLLPQVITMLLLAIGLAYAVWYKGHPVSLLLLAAIAQGLLQLTVLGHWLFRRPVRADCLATSKAGMRP